MPLPLIAELKRRRVFRALVAYGGIRGRSKSSDAPPSIVVLPFVNLSAERENEYFSDGMTEEIINALANIEGLRVVARTSAFSFKGKNVDIRKIGEELKVSTVLEGTVRRQGNQLRVAAQLIAANDGYHLWSKTYERELNDMFLVEDDVARAIVQALKPKLVQPTAMVERTTDSSEAHDLYLKGRYLWNQRSKEGLTRAIALFERAIALDAGYSLAHSGLADCYNVLGDYGGTQGEEVASKGKTHALAAVKLDDGLAEGHASLAAYMDRECDWDGANREFKRAIELRPGYATAHHWYGFTLLGQGRLAEARAEAERARQLDPTSVIINTFLVTVLHHAGEYDAAVDQAQKTLDLNPGFDLARVFLAYSHLRAGRLADALGALDRAPAPSSQLSVVRAHLLAASGATTDASAYADRGRGAFRRQPGATWIPRVGSSRARRGGRGIRLVGKGLRGARPIRAHDQVEPDVGADTLGPTISRPAQTDESRALTERAGRQITSRSGPIRSTAWSRTANERERD